MPKGKRRTGTERLKELMTFIKLFRESHKEYKFRQEQLWMKYYQIEREVFFNGKEI